jgi:hypothetical protein
MATFRSNEELFQAVAELTARLEAGGHRDAATALRDGFGCLNGLTDGWALFLQSIEKVAKTYAKRFAPDERRALAAIRAAVHQAVHRR